MDNLKTISKLEPGEFYMHEYQNDVCIEVLDVSISSKDIYEVTVNYWNLGYTGRPWKISREPEAVRIHASSLDFWHHLDYDVLVQARVLPGPPKGELI